MNSISAKMYQSKNASLPYPVLAIDGIAIEIWIKGVVFNQLGDDETKSLVPAQGWLVDEDEQNAAWELLFPLNEDSSTFVPLLICPDDVDLNCTVAVVEQVIESEKIIWSRFGRAVNVKNGVVTSVRWNTLNQRAEFKRDEFLSAYSELKRLIDSEWI